MISLKHLIFFGGSFSYDPPPLPQGKNANSKKKRKATPCLRSAGPEANPSLTASRSISRRMAAASSGLTKRRKRWNRAARVTLGLETAMSATVAREVASSSRRPTTKYLIEGGRRGGKNVGRRGGVGGGCTQFVNGRSRMTVDPRIPTVPGRSTSGLYQPVRYCLHQAGSAVRCSASRMKGELHPSKNRS